VPSRRRNGNLPERSGRGARAGRCRRLVRPAPRWRPLAARNRGALRCAPVHHPCTAQRGVHVCPNGTSDRAGPARRKRGGRGGRALRHALAAAGLLVLACSEPTPPSRAGDRKSTRLNSSHVSISYAVFCLKKKKKKKMNKNMKRKIYRI